MQLFPYFNSVYVFYSHTRRFHAPLWRRGKGDSGIFIIYSLISTKYPLWARVRREKWTPSHRAFADSLVGATACTGVIFTVRWFLIASVATNEGARGRESYVNKNGVSLISRRRKVFSFAKITRIMTRRYNRSEWIRSVVTSVVGTRRWYENFVFLSDSTCIWAAGIVFVSEKVFKCKRTFGWKGNRRANRRDLIPCIVRCAIRIPAKKMKYEVRNSSQFKENFFSAFYGT